MNFIRHWKSGLTNRIHDMSLKQHLFIGYLLQLKLSILYIYLIWCIIIIFEKKTKTVLLTESCHCDISVAPPLQMSVVVDLSPIHSCHSIIVDSIERERERSFEKNTAWRMWWCVCVWKEGDGLWRGHEQHPDVVGFQHGTPNES